MGFHLISLYCADMYLRKIKCSSKHARKRGPYFPIYKGSKWLTGHKMIVIGEILGKNNIVITEKMAAAYLMGCAIESVCICHWQAPTVIISVW